MQNQIPKNWQKVKLGEIANFSYGKMPVKEKLKNNGQYPVYSGYQIVGNYDEYNSDEDLIVVARGVGGTGDVKISPAKSFVTNLSIMIKLNEDIVNKEYLFYKYSHTGLRYLDSGSAQSQITISDLQQLDLNLPPLVTQQEIAKILSVFDDKIEVNNKIAKTLEEMAQVLFKEWFVNFRFPGYEKVEFVNSELGKIPKGWEIKNLKNIVDLIASRYTGNNSEDRIPYLPIDLIQSKTLLLNKISSPEEAKSSLIKFLENDILFGAMRPYFFKVAVAPFDGLSRTTCFVFRPKDNRFFGYSVFLIFRQETVDYATNVSQGSTIPYAKWNGVLSEMDIVLPPTELLDEFNEIAIPVIEKIEDIYFENQRLAALRDLLLPKLMKGEIRV